jgi:hypothetical protein
MNNNYYFKDDIKDEYLLHLEKNNKKKKKYTYTFFTDLFKLTIPFITILGTILLIIFTI